MRQNESGIDGIGAASVLGTQKASRGIGGLMRPKFSMVNVFFVILTNTGLVGREKYWGNT
jgi:hypothetical protein